VSLETLELIVQGMLATVLVVGGIVLALIQLERGSTPTLPDWLTLAIGSVMGYFFGTRMARSANQSERQP